MPSPLEFVTFASVCGIGWVLAIIGTARCGLRTSIAGYGGERRKLSRGRSHNSMLTSRPDQENVMSWRGNKVLDRSVFSVNPVLRRKTHGSDPLWYGSCRGLTR
jgi:hypothetical protein